MFDRILYPTDFSEAAAAAVPFIQQLREAGAREVIVVHVVDGGILAPAAEIFESEARAALDDVVGRLRAAGLAVRPEFRVGGAAHEILELAREERVSVIVIGSHGKGLVREALLGSVSDAVVRRAQVPVLVVKPRRADEHS